MAAKKAVDVKCDGTCEQLKEAQGLSMRLEILCATKDAEIAALQTKIAQMNAETTVARLRAHCGASEKAQFDPRSFTFVEPQAEEPIKDSVVKD